VLTVTEAASRAGVSVSLIYVWCADGTLSHLRVGRKGKRGHIRIAEEDLDTVLAEFKVAKPAIKPASQGGISPPLRLKHVRVKP
jgi:excisionase family DNA binding protein